MFTATSYSVVGLPAAKDTTSEASKPVSMPLLDGIEVGDIPVLKKLHVWRKLYVHKA
ncbi:hypothetical protein E4U50_003200 [Claviceps purpurea]|nr:hypothetical protein E4U50_003200 [Claviceps purpurea]